MLSIPRDLWVRLCTGGNGKIDQAFLHGGAQCAIQTVERDLRVHIDYYAWIGLQGLVSVLNELGGVNVIANNPVMDDYYPADLSGGNPFDYQRILVLPGAQHMSGTLALEYVRARHDDAYGDFATIAAAATDPDRAARQDEAPLARGHPEPRDLARLELPDQHEHRPGERAAADRGLGAARIDHAGGAAAAVHQHSLRRRAGRADAQLVADPAGGREVLPGGRREMRRAAILIALMIASGLAANRTLAVLQTHATTAALISTHEPAGAVAGHDLREPAGLDLRDLRIERAQAGAPAGWRLDAAARPADGSLLVIRRFDAYSDLYHVTRFGARHQPDDVRTISRRPTRRSSWTTGFSGRAISPDGSQRVLRDRRAQAGAESEL